MRIKKGQLRRIIQEYGQQYVEPTGNVIGVVGADIDGDHRYYQELTVTHDPSTDEITIVVKDQGAAGGMDGPGGSTGFMLSGKQVLPAGAKGRDVVAAIKNLISRTADTIKRYGKPSRNFTWADSTYSRGPKGLNAKLATAALRKARGMEENSQLTEKRPRQGLDTREFGRKVIYLRDGSEGIVVAVTRDIILLKSGERIIPSQVDWRRTNESAIREGWAATAQEEAEKINAQTGAGYVTDQAFWEKSGIVTGEDLALDILSQTYSDMYKDINGIRPRWIVFSTPEEAQAEIAALDVEYERMRDDRELEAAEQKDYEEKKEIIKAVGVQAMDYDDVPKNQGMGNRPHGKKSQRRWEGKKLYITRKKLMEILGEESTWINEMPVSKSRGYMSQDVDTRHPHIKELSHEIDSIFQEWNIDADVEMFDSGYVGISIEFTDEAGKPQKWIVVDQPGKVGLEDQSMGYIFFGPGGKAIQQSNAWIYEKVPYLGRKFGDANMRDDARQQTYDAIIDTIDDMMRTSIGMGGIDEADTKKYDDDSALKGGQSKLPDELQKGIIDKTIEDREEDEEEKKDEGFRLLNKMIMQEIAPRMKGSGNEHPHIGQWDTNDPGDPLQIAIALRNTWDEVSIDVGISRPTAEEMGDEAVAMLATYYPDEASAFHTMGFDEQDRILVKAFGRR